MMKNLLTMREREMFKRYDSMKAAWFVVTCTVDNGCVIEDYETYVYALTNFQAKEKTLKYWRGQDSETDAKIKSCRLLRPDEIITRSVK